MSKRKYRQYTPGRTPGVKTIIRAIRETDLTEVDGRTRLRPGESREFNFDLQSSVRSYTQWKSLARQLACGACTLEVLEDGQPVLSTSEIVTSAGEVPLKAFQTHAVPASEEVPALKREREVLQSIAQPAEELRGAVPTQEGRPDPIFRIEGSVVEPVQPESTKADLPPESDPIPEVAKLGEPVMDLPVEVEVPKPIDLGRVSEILAPEQEIAPTDYSKVRRPRTKKEKK